ncbi:hypothetical protein [Caulobacter sp. Root655]|uniref:hypothetical protein n=1 Tax=Caulobacter sp. Root655 TaxID=1736578 RepID=UPI0012E3CD4D|nr:hypothetical protein [Caulobacter sp. Root655]
MSELEGEAPSWRERVKSFWNGLGRLDKLICCGGILAALIAFYGFATDPAAQLEFFSNPVIKFGLWGAAICAVLWVLWHVGRLMLYATISAFIFWPAALLLTVLGGFVGGPAGAITGFLIAGAGGYILVRL